ncbi:MAG: MlaD family protein [Owenweeksia sp.]|nr:MlaD family protein [Owenweeksia sp.]
MKVSREFKVSTRRHHRDPSLYWGVNFLKGQNLFSDERVYYAVYARVDGLTNACPVTINGYQVGQVDQVYFHPDGSGRLMVKMQMNNEFPVAANSVASIQSTDLLGEKSIELVLGKGPGVAKSGDTLRSNIKLTLTEEVNQQVAPLKTKAEKLFAFHGYSAHPGIGLFKYGYAR